MDPVLRLGFGVAVVVTLTLLLFLGLFGNGVYQQLRTIGFAQTQGSVIESGVVTGSAELRGQGGAVYSPKVTYEYQVAGRVHTNDVIRAGVHIRYNRREQAQDIANRYPQGATVPVYYDAAEPERSVLDAGLGTDEVAITAFMMPFVCIAITMWAWMIPAIRGSRRGAVAGGVFTFYRPPYHNALMSMLPPYVAGLLAVTAVSAIGFIGLSVGVRLLSIENLALTALIACGVTLLAVIAGIVAWRRRRRTLESPRYWLTIDEQERDIVLPVFGRRQEVELVPIAEVESVTATELRHCKNQVGPGWCPGKKGDEPAGTLVLLHRSGVDDDGKPLPPVPAAYFMLPRRADSFADWLCKHTGLPRGERA